MNDNHHNQDEALLIDFLMGHCDTEQAKTVGDRLESDPAFAELHANLANTFGAMDLDPTPQVPEGLVARTMAHIDSQTQLDSLLTQQAVARDKSWWSSWRNIATAAAITLLLFAAIAPWFLQKAPTAGPNQPDAARTAGMYDPANPDWEPPQTGDPTQIIIMVPNVAHTDGDTKLLPMTPTQDAPMNQDAP